MNEMTRPKSCPACGSTNIEESFEDRSMIVPLAPAAQYSALIDHCRDCDTRGDFQRANTARIQFAVQHAKKASLGILISGLMENGDYSMAAMERILGLSQRTMMRWKGGNFSDSALALIRFVSTYPWLLDVADARFDRTYAQQRLAIEGIRAAAQLAESLQISQGIAAQTDSQSQRTTGIFTIAPALLTTEKNTTLSLIPA